MIGAIAGDMIGSPYEFKKVPIPEFDLFTEKSKFTDDTVLSIGLFDSIDNKTDWISTLHEYYEKYKDNGFGGYFIKWCQEKDREPYGSWANGSAMRVSPVAWMYDTLPEVLHEAKMSSIVTHNHPSAIKGAQAIAACIYLARMTKDKQVVANYVNDNFYITNKTLKQIRKDYLDLEDKKVACTAQFSVPAAIECFLDSDNFEDCVRKAVLLGGDTDTVASMSGAIAEGYYGVSNEIFYPMWDRLDNFLRRKLIEFHFKYQKKMPEVVMSDKLPEDFKI